MVEVNVSGEASARLGIPDRSLDLSMGMSRDLEWAIAEDATIARLSTAIFGPAAPNETAHPHPCRPVKIDSMTSVFAGISASILALAPITNPIGALAAFAGLTAGNTPAAIRSQAWKTGIYVFAILTTFTVCGSFIMRFFGFDLPSLQIAGGLVVAHSGFSMLENKRRSTNEEDQHATLKEDVSFSPMALPLIAGPGSIGVVIALAARNTAVGFQIGIVLGILITAATIAVLLRYGTPWIDKLGATGVGAITRIMGFLILVIGVELVIHGIRALQLF